MIAWSWVLLLNAQLPVTVAMDPCLEQWVATTSVAASLEVELLPRGLILERNADVQIGCEGQEVQITAAGRRWSLPLLEVSPSDRARVLALTVAESLRSEAPGGPRFDPPEGAPATSSQVDVPTPPTRWSLLANSTVLKLVGDTGVVGVLQASAHHQSGALRPRLGGGAWVGVDGDPSYFGLFLSLGADLTLFQTEDLRFGLQASAAGGGFIEFRDRVYTLVPDSGANEVSGGDRLAPFGLITGGLFLEQALGEASALNFELGAGTFLPAAATAVFSVGLRVDP